jgi:hypothetical protein
MKNYPNKTSDIFTAVKSPFKGNYGLFANQLKTTRHYGNG